MRGVVFLGDGEFEVRDLPDPVPGPGEVLIKMEASGICGSDLRMLRRPKPRGGAREINPAGHEPCGTVAALGPGVTGVEVGKRTIVYHYSGCGRCKYCRIGYHQLCVHGHTYYGASWGGRGGGHADYMVAPAHVCMDLPDAMCFEEGAAIACGTGTAYAAVKRLGISGGDTLAVFGQGPVGLSATLIGSGMGARVIGVDVVPYRLELAKRLGAAEVLNASDVDPVEAIKELTRGEGAEATLECSAIPAVRAQVVDSTKLFGRACFVGEGGSLTLENVSQQVIHRHLTIYGSWTFSTWMLEEAANWIVDRGVPLKDLITHRFSLEQAEEAYRVFQEGQTGKVVFVWER